jgi:hypothetical protein
MKIESATPRLFRVALGMLVLGLLSGGTNNVDGAVPNPCYDFVTGGGWFSPTPLGPGRANFGFNAGYKNGEPPPPLRGELDYIDHNNGMHVKATSVDSYVGFNCNENGKDCADRVFEGGAEINGVGGFGYTVEVIDHGEPGNAPKGDDRIIVSLSNGYYADSGGAFLHNPPDQNGIDGGNIQVHKPCNGVSPS